MISTNAGDSDVHYVHGEDTSLPADKHNDYEKMRLKLENTCDGSLNGYPPALKGEQSLSPFLEWVQHAKGCNVRSRSRLLRH